MKRKPFYLLAILIFSFHTIQGQRELLPERFDFEQDLQYDESIPSPAMFLGYELGEALTLYAHVEQYLKLVAEKSDRVLINTYGETYEGRKLYNLVISSAENIRNIESLRETNLKIMNPVDYPGFADEAVMAKAPVFVSFSYNIHGNETSSTEAAMQVIYRLAAANDPGTAEILDNAVIIIYPCINADGRDRYVYWYKSSKRAVLGKEPRDLEHYEPFPNGRTNHYWFDLNRDWVWGVHPESRGHTAAYNQWMPQLHTDYHEMGYNSNYFTMPGTTPRNKLLPDAYEPLSDTIGKANIAAFNEYKVNYYTRESFDFFYPGYGSSYPSVMGAIGMLVEQGGISGGRAVVTNDDYVLTLRQRVYDHYRTSFATMAKAVERRSTFLEYGHRANNPANSKSPTKAYLVKNDGNPYVTDFLKIMSHHGIKIHRLKSDKVLKTRSYRDGNWAAVGFKEGDFVVDAHQHKHLFIHSVMARNLAIEDSVMYDMATWSLPLAYNLEAFESEIAVGPELLEIIEEVEIPATLPVIDENTYAVVIDWNQRYAPKALSMLWDKGYRVRVAEKQFKITDMMHKPGALVVLTGRNWEKRMDMDRDFREIADATGIRYEAYLTGRAKEGVDIASNDIVPIKKPKLGMLTGPPFDAYSSGQVYFLFDQETAFPIERIRTEILEQTALPKFGSRYGYADLFDYDVMILTGGGNNLKALFDEETLKIWKMWLEGGGTLIATESAAEFFAGQSALIQGLELAKPPRDTSLTSLLLAYEDREDYFGKKRIPGSAVNSTVDVSNPLGFGVNRELYTLKSGTTGLKPSANLQALVRYAATDSLLVAGFISEENKQILGGNISAGVVNVGRGKVVLLLDNTQFRMFWRGPSRIMQNAVMFNGQ